MHLLPPKRRWRFDRENQNGGKMYFGERNWAFLGSWWRNKLQVTAAMRRVERTVLWEAGGWGQGSCSYLSGNQMHINPPDKDVLYCCLHKLVHEHERNLSLPANLPHQAWTERQSALNRTTSPADASLSWNCFLLLTPFLKHQDFAFSLPSTNCSFALKKVTEWKPSSVTGWL